MKRSSYSKIQKKYNSLIKTIAKELNCVIHSSMRTSMKDNILEIEIKTHRELKYKSESYK